MGKLGMLLVFVLMGCGLCAQPADKQVYVLDGDLTRLLNLTHSQRSEILTPYYEWGLRQLDSTEIFSTIGELRQLATEHHDSDLLLEIELMEVHYFIYRPRFARSLVVDKLKQLNTRAQQENALWLEIRAQNMLGNYHFSTLEEYELGFEYFQRMTYLLEGVGTDVFPLKSEAYYQVGAAYYYFHDYAQAAEMLSRSLGAYRPRSNDWYLLQSMNTLALCYRKLNQLDSSNHYFQRLNAYAVSTKNEIWQGVSNGNLGYNYQLLGEYEQAQPLIEQELEAAKKVEAWGIVGTAHINLAEMHLAQQQYAQAREHAQQAKRAIYRSGQFDRKASLFQLLAKIASLDAAPELAHRYLDSAVIVNDSMERASSSLKLMRAKQKVTLEQQKIVLERERQAHERRVLLRNGIILFLALVLIIGLLGYLANRLRVKNKQQKLAAEKEAALLALERFKKSVIEKNQLIADVQQQLSDAQAQHETLGQPTMDSESQQRIINQLLESTLLTEDGWNEFVDMFEQVHAGFFDRLTAKWPTLTKAEIRFLALSRLKLENREMASMLGVGTDAIRQVKSRLRKKIGLQTSDSFETLTESI